ncbi:uncharacterized protein MYCFIDRAFT_177535 [Pseudocercospora fijiensis CIRAD86]|uniref:Uncharacterized protein n=1 Tax=Pseudocercospora fijiensis (strain CIRAD86) TaxID=383855 RepID=M3ATX7_PSEFD|nr:uncharacterized protein MYCFIDRAFT_177535 [Pseudocercospora fijiensis CIRAD86]EME80603.1 hypothetical protein MYCFIDRAFT_177535 [Pseudocercospora fijiensis CIRAD86]
MIKVNKALKGIMEGTSAVRNERTMKVVGFGGGGGGGGGFSLLGSDGWVPGGEVEWKNRALAQEWISWLHGEKILEVFGMGKNIEETFALPRRTAIYRNDDGRMFFEGGFEASGVMNGSGLVLSTMAKRTDVRKIATNLEIFSLAARAYYCLEPRSPRRAALLMIKYLERSDGVALENFCWSCRIVLVVSHSGIGFRHSRLIDFLYNSRRKLLEIPEAPRPQQEMSSDSASTLEEVSSKLEFAAAEILRGSPVVREAVPVK